MSRRWDEAEFRAFVDWLDTQPRSPEGLVVRTRDGETRTVPYDQAARQFRSHQQSARQRFPRLERCRSLTTLLGHQLEREERDAC